MSFAPVGDTPVAAFWPATTAVAASGSYRASDIGLGALWAVEINAGRSEGVPAPPPYGIVAGLPVAAAAMPNDPISSAPVVRVSDRWWLTEPTDPDMPNTAWAARLIEPPALEMGIAIYPDETRRADVSAGELTLANGDGGLDALTGDWSIVGRKVVISRGPHRRPIQAAYAEVGRVAEMRVAQPLSGTSRLTMPLRSIASDLSVPACRLYEGTGASEGPVTLAGQAKPRLFGIRRAVTPVLVDPGLLIYQVHDGAMQAVIEVRDRGLVQQYARNVSTYNELEIATVAEGDYVSCLATGHIRFGLTPTNVTVAARGDNALDSYGYAGSPAGIAAKILRICGGVDASRSQMDAFAAWPAAEAGIYLTGGTAAEAMEAIAARVHGTWGADAFGSFYGSWLVAPEDAGASVDIQPWMLRAPPEQQESARAPWWRARAAYQVLDTVLNGEAIAGAATAEDRAYFTAANRQSIALDFAVQSAYPMAEDGPLLESAFDSKDTTDALAARLMKLFGRPRRAWRVPIKGGTAGLSPAQFAPGTVVSFTYPAIAALASGFVGVVRDFSAVGDDLDLVLWG